MMRDNSCVRFTGEHDSVLKTNFEIKRENESTSRADGLLGVLGELQLRLEEPEPVGGVEPVHRRRYNMAKNKRTPTFFGELCNLTFFLREGIFDVFFNEKLGFGSRW